MSITKIYSLIFITLTVIVGFGFKSYSPPISPKINESLLLERHNYYRQQVGVPPLEWSIELADIAQLWANELAENCQMNHSNSNFGENIYWNGDSANEVEVVDNWASEERYFNHSKRIFKESATSLVGHYTQIIWRSTTQMGGAKQKCKHGGEIWVCNYDPSGNYIGVKVY